MTVGEQEVASRSEDTGEESVSVAVNCGMCALGTALYLLAATFCKRSVLPVSNPNPVYRTHACDNIYSLSSNNGARCSIVVKALCYKPESRGFETR
jgi:hypothetical protein